MRALFYFVLFALLVSTSIATSKEVKVFSPIRAKDAKTIESRAAINRDDPGIVTRYVTTKDSVTIEMCFSAGVTISLDDDTKETIQSADLDDNLYFSRALFKNGRSVYVRMIKELDSKADFWESSIRIMRASDDKIYLVNLVALRCTDDTSAFPKVVYLKDKPDVVAPSGSLLSPEDKVIRETKGYPRRNNDKVMIADMVTTSGSQSIYLALEVQPEVALKNGAHLRFAVLDNFELSNISFKREWLKESTKKATKERGRQAIRYNLAIDVNKDYITKSRFINLLVINEQTKHYQKIRVDLLKRFYGLKELGLDL